MIIMKSETIFVQKYPEHGYQVRTELVENPEEGCESIKMRSAYTMTGDYIGNRQNAVFLCDEKGIKPETIDAEHNVCSIGFCYVEQKWYGWSHRAIYGFGIGSSIKKGDIGYTTSDVNELAKELEKNGESGKIVDEDTVKVFMNDPPLECLDLGDVCEKEYYIVKTGHGSWTAITLDDAKQMAIDFANDVA